VKIESVVPDTHLIQRAAAECVIPCQGIVLGIIIVSLRKTRKIATEERNWVQSLVRLDKPIAENRILTAEIVVNARDVLINVLRFRRIKGKKIRSGVGQWHKLVGQIHGDGIQIRRRNVAGGEDRRVRRSSLESFSVLANQWKRRNSAGRRQVRKYSVPLIRGEDGGCARLTRLGAAVLRSLIGKEEKSFVFPDGSAHRAAVLVLMKDGGLLAEKIAGVQAGVTEELESIAVKFVGPGFCLRVQDGASVPTVFRIDGVRDHAHFRDGIGTGNNQWGCLLYTSPSPRDLSTSRMPSSA